MENTQMSKNDYVYNRLKEDISSGHFAPGEKLIVNSISGRYNVSPMPVRNAINKLQSEGFVVVTPRCGARVHVWDYDEFCNLMQISTVLEMTASKLASQFITEETIEELEVIMKKMNSAGMSRNFPLYEQYNHKFHFLIYSKCKNSDLMKQISDLHEKTYPYTSISFHIAGRLKLSMEQHRAWLMALSCHDALGCQEICRLQRTQSYSNFLNHLEHCLEHLDNPESRYYIYGFGSTFSDMSIDEIKAKIQHYRRTMEIL